MLQQYCYKWFIMEENKVAIVVPVYNGERFLKETIESCLRQEYDNYHIYLIDDLSIDGSKEIIDQYALFNTKLTVFSNLLNLGVVRSINNHINFIECDALLILGQDDVLEQNHLKMMMKDFNSSTAFIHCNSHVINEFGVQTGVYKDDDEQERLTQSIFAKLCTFNFVSSCGLMINMKYYNAVGGFSSKYRNFGEWMLWLKLAFIGIVTYNRDVKANYRRHSSNITNTLFSNNILKKCDFVSYTIDCRYVAFHLALKKQSLNMVEFVSLVSIICFDIVKLYFYKAIKWIQF